MSAAPVPAEERQPRARPWPPWLTRLLAFLGGVAVAVVAHYVLFRVGIPGTPFIYVSF
jgi:hypothetical protein